MKMGEREAEREKANKLNAENDSGHDENDELVLIRQQNSDQEEAVVDSSNDDEDMEVYSSAAESE